MVNDLFAFYFCLQSISWELSLQRFGTVWPHWPHSRFTARSSYPKSGIPFWLDYTYLKHRNHNIQNVYEFTAFHAPQITISRITYVRYRKIVTDHSKEIFTKAENYMDRPIILDTCKFYTWHCQNSSNFSFFATTNNTSVWYREWLQFIRVVLAKIEIFMEFFIANVNITIPLILYMAVI